MRLDARIFIAGHKGMVGSSINRLLVSKGFTNILTKTRNDLDLTNQQSVNQFFEDEQPEYVILAAAKVGGIVANNSMRGDFIRDNLSIQCNIIEAARKIKVIRLIFLGSSCIYPKDTFQPISESSLLTGPLEFTNRPYAVAKIAGIEMCWGYNSQYGTKYLAIMPSNLYGPGDNYHPENSHVIPGLIHRIHSAKAGGKSSIQVWGTGKPKREFLYVDDLARACCLLLDSSDEIYNSFLVESEPPLINVGSGIEISITNLVTSICKIVNFEGDVIYDYSKPDGAIRKLLNINKIRNLGWLPSMELMRGLDISYYDYLNRTHPDIL
jgi:GDP-L-fucose synthase